MDIRFGRVAIAAVVAEILGIVVLIAIVALFGPDERAAAEAYAMRLGMWVGPISGFVFCLLGGWWVAKRTNRAEVANGFATGVAAAAIDLALILVSGAPFLPIYAIANAGRIVAGTLGGWFARRPRERLA